MNGLMCIGLTQSYRCMLLTEEARSTRCQLTARQSTVESTAHMHCTATLWFGTFNANTVSTSWYFTRHTATQCTALLQVCVRELVICRHFERAVAYQFPPCSSNGLCHHRLFPLAISKCYFRYGQSTCDMSPTSTVGRFKSSTSQQTQATICSICTSQASLTQPTSITGLTVNSIACCTH